MHLKYSQQFIADL